jgi:hypothetical protein
VFCFKVFRFASEFLRHHEGNHKNEDPTGTKAVYMRNIFEELTSRASSELAKSATKANHKRTWEEAGGVTEAQLPKRVVQQTDDGIDSRQELLERPLALLTSIRYNTIHTFVYSIHTAWN